MGRQTSLIHTNSTISQRQTTLKNTFFDMFYLIYLRASRQNLVEKEWVEIKKSIFIFTEPLRRPTFFPLSFGFHFLFDHVLFQKNSSSHLSSSCQQTLVYCFVMSLVPRNTISWPFLAPRPFRSWFGKSMLPKTVPQLLSSK